MALKRISAPAWRLLGTLAVLALQAAYFPINRHVTGGVHLVTPVDHHIPLWPIWTIPYVLSVIWWEVSIAWAALKMDADLYRAFIIAMCTVMLTSYAIYLLYPTYVIRPLLEGDSFAVSLLRFVYGNDRVYNAFPSGHTYTSVLIALFWCRWYPRQRWLWGGIAGVVLLSTLFTRQHNLPDLIGGTLLAWLGYLFGMWLSERTESTSDG